MNQPLARTATRSDQPLDGGGKVAASIGATSKPNSATLTFSKEQLDERWNRDGKDFERWGHTHVGHAFDCRTQSEARYIARTKDVDAIRNRSAQAPRRKWHRSRGRCWPPGHRQGAECPQRESSGNAGCAFRVNVRLHPAHGVPSAPAQSRR
jgi:hypothetical protein